MTRTVGLGNDDKGSPWLHVPPPLCCSVALTPGRAVYVAPTSTPESLCLLFPHPEAPSLPPAQTPTPGPVRGQDSHLDCSFSAVTPPLFPPLKPKHSPQPDSSQVSPPGWLQSLGSETGTYPTPRTDERDRQGSGSGGWPSQVHEAPMDEPAMFSQDQKQLRGRGAGLQGWDPARAAMWERADPSSIK